MDLEADAWVDHLAESLGVPPLTASEKERLLGASRRVAHGVERAATPLSAFLVGMGVAAQTSAGQDREDAFDRVVQILLGQLPAEDP
jgi:hypothetical protein